MKETQVKNKIPKSCIFKDWHLANSSLGLRTQQYIAFSKRIKWDLSDALKYFAQTETEFLLASAENAKKKYFWHFSDRNLCECRWYIDKWPHLSNPLSELYPLIFPFQELKKFNAIWSVPPMYFVLVCKICIYMQKMALSILSTQISFFYRKSANFWYGTIQKRLQRKNTKF